MQIYGDNMDGGLKTWNINVAQLHRWWRYLLRYLYSAASHLQGPRVDPELGFMRLTDKVVSEDELVYFNHLLK